MESTRRRARRAERMATGMETIDGVWYMKGCRKDDPSRLRSPEDLERLVREIGFLPLFSNAVPGFSVEERTPAGSWWTDDPSTDPWSWRQALAPRDSIAYGKFFDRRAGFVSKEWFPVFANYRRDGYDYEGLYEDGKMKSRNRRIMDAFELDEEARGKEYLTCDLKKKAAVEKGFEGAVTELQMQTFLIVNGFRQRTNRRGEGYGWHVGVLLTPETKWGYGFVNQPSGTPAACRDRIFGRIRSFFPEAGDRDLQKILGIRY